MSYSFNLIDNAWIPCVTVRNGPPRPMSLQDTLASASRIKEISHPSPPVTVALHRLLLAVLHRNFGPENEMRWKELWDSGNWDTEILRRYFGNWRERFDLFDVEFPFYQARSLDVERHGVPISKIVMELAQGHNPTLFDHTTDESNFSLTPAEAACHLVAFQSFALGGLVTREKNEPPSASAAPLSGAAVVLVRGEDLFQTLMLNLHQYDPKRGIPFGKGADSPAWERDEETRSEDRYPSGYLDYMTWQSRRMKLKPEEDEIGGIVVRRVVQMSGGQFREGFSRHSVETMMAFRRNLKADESSDPWPCIRFTEGRALWRDSLALVQSVEEKQARPMILSWLDDLILSGHLLASATIPLDLLGTATDRHKILFWRHERLSVDPAYLHDADLLGTLRKALESAERTGNALAHALRNLAESIRALRQTPRSPDARKRREAREMSVRFTEWSYWPRLEIPFRRLLIDLPNDKRLIGEADWEYGTLALLEWKKVVRMAGLETFREAIQGLGGSARSLKAIAEAEQGFLRNVALILRNQDRERKEVLHE